MVTLVWLYLVEYNSHFVTVYTELLGVSLVKGL